MPTWLVGLIPVAAVSALAITASIVRVYRSRAWRMRQTSFRGGLRADAPASFLDWSGLAGRSPYRNGQLCQAAERAQQQTSQSLATVTKTTCDRTEVITETICDSSTSIEESVCDATAEIRETVCDSWKQTPLAGLICFASHVTSRIVCASSHLVSRTVCTASHVVSKTICVASHVVETVINVAAYVVTLLLCIVDAFVVALIGIKPPPPEAHFLIQARDSQTIEDVTTLVHKYLDSDWQVEKLFPGADPQLDLPQLASFYRIQKATELTENPFDVAYNLRDAAGFLRVDPDLPFRQFMGAEQ